MNDKQRSQFEKKMLAQLEVQASERLEINTEIKKVKNEISSAMGEPDSKELCEKFKELFGMIDQLAAKRSGVNNKIKQYNKELRMCIQEIGKWADGQMQFPDPGDEEAFLQLIQDYDEQQKSK